MTHMRSPGRGEMMDKMSPQTDDQAEPGGRSQKAATGEGGSSDSVKPSEHEGDAPVVLWDEVKPPETADSKPIGKDSSPDPFVH